jgi:rhamnose transport system ATP-binding protein
MSTSTGQERTAETAVRFRCVSKRFGPVLAVADVSLAIRSGSVHAFVGENGAGKSTLLGMLAGRLAVSEGSIEVFGAPIQTGDVRAARAAGVVAIYQELTIVPALSSCDNAFLGQPIARFGMLSEQAMRRRFDELCRRFGVNIAADALAGELSVADQQIIEILRALQSEACILLLDEPTSALPPPERQALFRRLGELRANGVTIILVSHNLDEVLAIADEVSVFRDGRLIRTAAASEWSKSGLISAMLGHEILPGVKRSLRAESRELLRAEDVGVPGKIGGISLAVDEGEILGLGGLVGSGRTTLMRALAGLEPQAQGRLWIEGIEVAWPKNPAQALAYGIALIPEDRREGLVMGRPAQENVILADISSVATAGFISEARLGSAADAASRSYGFNRDRLQSSTASLSGGNQQKLLIARWRHHRPKILLADEPTRGIDVGAKEEIMQGLRELAETGLSVVFVSSELEEVVAVSDRIIVLAAGRSAGHLGVEASVADILGAAFALPGSHV